VAVDETRVTYKAVASFIALHREAALARKDLQSIQKEEAKTNAASVAGSKRTAAAHRDATKALRSRTTSTKTATAAILAHNQALQSNLSLTRSGGSAAQEAAAKIKTASSVIKDATTETKKLGDSHSKVAFVAKEAASAEQGMARATNAASTSATRASGAWNKFRSFLTKANSEQKKFIPLSRRVESGNNNVLNTFKKLGNYRPHLIPPFVALIPIIAGLLSLLNPLVSILGAVGAAGFGAGSGILSMGGAAIAIVPMVSAAVAAVASLMVAFKGIGGVFSKYSQGKAASGGGGGGGGGGGKSAADQAYDLMKAQERLTDAQEAAVEAQQNLNDARADAVKKLAQLHKAIVQDVLDEADAQAALQQATEDYYNVMADPGSTLGDKMAATANLNDAQQALSDSQQQAVDDQNDLNEAQAAGIDGDKEVIAAQKQLRDALRGVRDAQHDLNDQVNGGGSSGGGGGVGAMDEFNKALAKLSPSAQKVVLALIAMQGAWEKVQRTVQEAFFSKIVDDMDDLEGMLPTVENLLSKAAGAMGRLAHNFIMMVSSDKWKGDLAIISDQNVQLIDLAGAAVLNLLNALKDVVIAAGPFAVKLVGSFEKLTKSFAGIVANARETGSLAAWLDVVYGRIQQWWRIIKNVAGALVNYGSASAEFGKWITDGLEKSTEAWLTASEEAKKKDSPFKKWLEDIKPLLRQIRGLFSDFFGWLGDTAKNNDAIKNATDILSTIREKLGPALSKLFDSLNESGIGKSFVDSLSSIVESISAIVDEGGAEGFKSFFKVVSLFFKDVADFGTSPGGKWVISHFMPAMGTLAAMTFIGKFTGLFTLFGWLQKLAKSAAVTKLLTNLGKIDAIKNVPANLAKAGAVAAIAVGGVKEGKDRYDAIGKSVDIQDQYNKDKNIKDPKKRAAATNKDMDNIQRLNGEQGAAPITAITNLIDMIFKSKMTDAVNKVAGDIGVNMGNFFRKTVPDWWNGFAKWFTASVWTPVSNFFTVILPGWWDGFAKWFNTSVWTPVSTFFTVTIPLWWSGFTQWFNTSVWTPVSNFFTATLPSWWGGFTQWFNSSVWTPVSNFFTITVPSWWGGLTRWFNTSVWAPVSTFFSSTIPSWWGGLTKWFSTSVWAPVATFFTRTLPNWWNGIVGWFSGRSAPGGAIGGLVSKKAAKGAIGGFVDGKAQYLSTGGTVRTLGDRRYNMDPKGTDTEPTMLTPGEYVVKKERVDEVGADNMQAFNDGVLSFAALMGKKKNGKDGGVGYFNGGGLVGAPINGSAIMSSMKTAGITQYMTDNSMHFGDINIYNPKKETASDSLPTAIRKVSYAGGRRKPSPRLETTDA
jgi:hypothetical protein